MRLSNLLLLGVLTFSIGCAGTYSGRDLAATRGIIGEGRGQSFSSGKSDESMIAVADSSIRAQDAEHDRPVDLDSRVRVYSAEFHVLSGDVERSTESFIKAVSEVGGYLDSQLNSSIVCRVPAASFYPLVERIEEFGTVTNRSIKADDVTDQYTDFELRLNVSEAARRRLTSLMERTATLTELLQLEEELVKLTTQIESLKGNLRQLKQNVAYSTIRISFDEKLITSSRKDSPFGWINHLGADIVQNAFVATEPGAKKGLGIFSSKPPMETPAGFILVGSGKHELQALTPDDARLWLREFSVHEDADLEFWTKALKTHFVENRGYKILSESRVAGQSGMTNRQGHQILFEAYTCQGPVNYLITISLWESGFVSPKKAIDVVEFVAARKLFEEYRDSVSQAAPFKIVCRPDIEEANARSISQTTDVESRLGVSPDQKFAIRSEPAGSSGFDPGFWVLPQ